MDARARELIKIGDGLFSRRRGVLELWQEVAENFYPERADFTAARADGSEFAAHLMSSFPAMARRELGNIFASLLRPRGTEWFSLHAGNQAVDEDTGARRWLEWADGVQRRAMYDPQAQFVRATREADHDFAAFGQAVISVEPVIESGALLYRAWHLRDCAFVENVTGRVDALHRKWKPTARQLAALFPNLHPEVRRAAEKEPEREFACRHVVVPATDYALAGGEAAGTGEAGFVSLHVEEENEFILEEAPLAWFPYVVPRWQTVSGSPYARSPATELCLPDARLLQAMTRVLLEAGEKAVDPPSIAAREVFRQDMNFFAGGVTFADLEADQDLRQVFQTVSPDKSGIPLGINMAERVEAALQKGFFLDKLGLPDVQAKTMTAYEVRKIIEEHVRQSAPLFEPIEEEYNAPLCQLTFRILRAQGVFGPPEQLPQPLRGADIDFTFFSPLREIADEMKGQQLQEAVGILGAVAQVDPGQLANIRWTEATRDALRGIRIPAKWLATEEEVAARQQAEEQKKMLGDVAAMIGTGADVAGKAGAAIQTLQGAAAGVGAEQPAKGAGKAGAPGPAAEAVAPGKQPNPGAALAAMAGGAGGPMPLGAVPAGAGGVDPAGLATILGGGR
jgi:hypothetical protein